MGKLYGLKDITAHIDAEEARFANRSDPDAPKTKWFKLADKQSVKVVFLQELDPNSDTYSQKNGLGFLAVEHQSPKNFMRKALCSIGDEDEGKCWACEQHKKDFKAGWKQKTRLYINVLVDDGTNEPYVAVLSQGNGPKSITPALIEYAGRKGKISDREFYIKRNGSGQTDTSYLLTPDDAHSLNVEDYEVFDLDGVVREVPYAQQEAHYLNGESVGEAEQGGELVGAGAAKADSEVW
jgi:hypothetical protein